MPGLTVAKFGGSSLGAESLFGNVLDAIQDRSTAGPLVVVVSALGTVTDRLDALADGEEVEDGVETVRAVHARMADRWLGREERADYGRLLDRIADHLAAWGRFEAGFGSNGDGTPGPDPVRDEILAAGERLSAPLVAAALRSRGVSARAVDAAELVRTRRDPESGEVTVNLAATRRAIARWWDQWDRAVVPIVTGFIGGDGEETMTLSRGGSDYSASIFARVLGAEVFERWTDVAGLFRQDPEEHPDAERFAFLGFEEALRRTREGRLGMHPRTLDPLRESSTRVHVRSTPDPEAPGTVIAAADAREPIPEPASSRT